MIEDSRRMNDPSHGVIEELALRESLVAAFVSNDPEARHPQSSEERVESPDSELPKLVEVGTGELNEFWANAGVEEVGRFVRGNDEGNVHHAVQRALSNNRWTSKA